MSENKTIQLSDHTNLLATKGTVSLEEYLLLNSKMQ